MTTLKELLGMECCSRGKAFIEPMRIHQPVALYVGCEHWLFRNGRFPAGVVAQHGYYREMQDQENARVAYKVADARRQI